MSKRILVVYYSHSGNTGKIARLIQEETNGELLEIKPEKPYPIPYDDVVAQAKVEIQKGFKPLVKNGAIDSAAYDVIFVGSPNWWSTIAPPITTFLTENDLSGKTVLPFCTHGGGGGGHVAKDIAALCTHSTVGAALVLYDDGGASAKSQVAAWLKSQGER